MRERDRRLAGAEQHWRRTSAAPGGLLYFVVSVVQPTIVFDAHRIFRARDILAAFGELALLEFSHVLDDGRFVERLDPALAETQRCGCCLLRRQG